MAHKSYAIKKGVSQPSKSRLPLILIGGALAMILIGAFVLLHGSSAPRQAVEVTGKPKLSVDREQIDFGKVPLGKPVTAAFELSNVGDQPLQLASVPKVELREGCWPPNALVSSTTIQPGQTAKLSMQFMMHEGMAGKHDFRVHVKTNDPDQPERELIILSDWG